LSAGRRHVSGGLPVNRHFHKEHSMATKSTRNETTSPRAASAAGRVLRDPKSTPVQRTAAASALTQVASRPKPASSKR